jgi:hypothetical protein
MSKKEKNPERIIFLRLFTREILLKILQEEKSKINIESEKLKQKIFTIPAYDEEKSFLSLTDNFKIDKNQTKINANSTEKENKRLLMIHRENVPSNLQVYSTLQVSKHKEIKKEVSEKPTNFQEMEKSLSLNEKTVQDDKHFLQNQKIRNLINPPKSIQQINISPMDKISPLLKDNTIIRIECSGPGKNIVVKRYNQTNTTRIVLTEEDIKLIVNHFAKEARIPLAGGILKAAVGNSVISAVISEFVGSRFIISKITPYSLLGTN